jgi:hypothetical protein
MIMRVKRLKMRWTLEVSGLYTTASQPLNKVTGAGSYVPSNSSSESDDGGKDIVNEIEGEREVEDEEKKAIGKGDAEGMGKDEGKGKGKGKAEDNENQGHNDGEDNEVQGTGQVNDGGNIGDDEGDAEMCSPPPAEGASCTTGGILRGRAVGNVLNHADAPDMVADQFAPAKGVVRLYSDLAQHPAQVRPTMTLKSSAAPTLAPILKKLARSYSPVQSKCQIMLLIDLVNMLLEQNFRIYIHEDDNWNIRGRFMDAVEDDEEVTWTPQNGQLTLSICAEGRDPFHTSTMDPVPTAPVSKPIAAHMELSKPELIALLNIPEHLTDHKGKAGLKMNYAKYKACLEASNQVDQKIGDGTWPQNSRRPTFSMIVELFVSKTYWHTYMVPAFGDIDQYPLLQDWLEDKTDGPPESKIWSTVKTTYNFADLMKEKGRGKRKEGTGREKYKDNDKEEAGKSKKSKKKKTK